MRGINLRGKIIEELFGKNKNKSLRQRINQIIEDEADKLEKDSLYGKIKHNKIKPGILHNRCIRKIRLKRIQSRCNY